MLPTPSAYESTPTDEFSEEVREHLLDTHRRLYLPGRKWHSQRTLSRMAGALLPTPNASDDKGGEGPTRWARQEAGSTGGPALKDIAHLLPTPTRQDGENTAGPSQFERHTPPLNAVVTELLPTPAAADGSGGRLDNAETVASGKRPSGAKAELTLRSALTHKLLPTPTAEDGERGQGADAARKWGPSLRGAVQEDAMLPTPRTVNRASRKAMVENDQWAAPQLEQVAELVTGVLPREFDSPDEVPGASRQLLPTPTSQDARQNALNEAEAQRNPATMWATMGRIHHGDHTSPRFGGGSRSSDEQHPDQLTLEDG